MENYIVGVGAANYDVTGKSKEHIIMHDSNPGVIHTSIGGVTRNVLENIVRIGYSAKLITAFGDDWYGQSMLNHCNRVNIDTSHCLIVRGGASSSYMAVLGDDGDMALALSDMSILQNITVDYLKEKDAVIKHAKLLTFDPCLPEEMIDYITSTVSKDLPLFCDPASSAYAHRLKPYVGKIHTLKPNAMELAILSECDTSTAAGRVDACRALIDKGVKRIFVSLGKDGCLYYDNQGTCVQRCFKPIVNVVNASGAGDSFMGAAIYSYVNRYTIDQTIDYALASGMIALLSQETIHQDLSKEYIEKIIQENRL